MHRGTPVVLFWDDLHLTGALIGLSQAFHCGHTNPLASLHRAVHASRHDSVLCSGRGGLSHLLGILPVFVPIPS